MCLEITGILVLVFATSSLLKLKTLLRSVQPADAEITAKQYAFWILFFRLFFNAIAVLIVSSQSESQLALVKSIKYQPMGSF